MTSEAAASPAADSAGEAFDPDFYLATNEDVRALGFDPADHFWRFGRAEGRPGNARQAAASGAPSSGVAEGAVAVRRSMPLAPSRPAPNLAIPVEPDPESVAAEGVEDGEGAPGWFDPAYYRDNNPDVVTAALDPFEHYVNHGIREGRSPNRVIGRLSGRSLAVRGRLAEERAILARSGLFDVAWYAETYGVRPEQAIAHYVRTGAFLGNDPSLFFSSLDYTEANPDILTAGVNPLVHYITFGFRENREGVRTLSETRLTARVWLKGF